MYIYSRKTPEGYGKGFRIVHSNNEITDMYFTTVSLGPDAATLFVSYELTTDLRLLPELELRTEGRCGDSALTATRKASFVAGNYRIQVKNPLVWWPRGYGQPKPIYGYPGL